MARDYVKYLNDLRDGEILWAVFGEGNNYRSQKISFIRLCFWVHPDRHRNRIEGATNLIQKLGQTLPVGRMYAAQIEAHKDVAEDEVTVRTNAQFFATSDYGLKNVLRGTSTVIDVNGIDHDGDGNGNDAEACHTRLGEERNRRSELFMMKKKVLRRPVFLNWATKN